MNNTPSTKPPSSSERPKGSGFRNAIYALLLIGAGLGIGKCVFDKKDTDNPNKPDIADTRGASGESGDDDPDRTPKGWIPVNEKTAEYVNLAECRALVFKLDPRVISEDEMLKMADKIKNDKDSLTAEGIFARFCIEDTKDREDIRKLITKGFKLKTVKKNGDGSWTMIFINPKADEESGNEEWLELNEKFVCKWLTPEEEEDFKSRKKNLEKEKKMIEDIKNGQTDQILSQFDTDKIKKEAFSKGIEKEEIIKELIKIINKAQASIKSGMSKEEKIKLACTQLIPDRERLMKLQAKLLPDVLNKIKDNPNLPIGEFGDFVDVFGKYLGLVGDMEDCTFYLMGVK